MSMRASGFNTQSLTLHQSQLASVFTPHERAEVVPGTRLWIRVPKPRYPCTVSMRDLDFSPCETLTRSSSQPGSARHSSQRNSSPEPAGVRPRQSAACGIISNNFTITHCFHYIHCKSNGVFWPMRVRRGSIASNCSTCASWPRSQQPNDMHSILRSWLRRSWDFAKRRRSTISAR